MTKPQKNDQGLGALEGLLILVIVGLLGFTGWYVLQAKRSTDKSLLPSSSATPKFKKKVVTQKAAVQLPEGWINYEGDGFTFGYPGSYGQFTARSTTQVTGGIQAVLTSSQPATALFKGISTAGLFVLDNYEATNAPIQSRKYGPTIKLENGKWLVTQSSSGDPKSYKIGDTYNEVTATQKSGTTVYTFTSGDEGNILHTLAFTAKGHLYTLQLPGFDTGTYASQTANDQKPYDQLSSQLADHIVVK